VTTKEVCNPIVYFISQSKQGDLVHEGDMAHSVECFGKIQTYDVDNVITLSKL